MTMRIVNQRGEVITAEKFRKHLSKLFASAVETANLSPKAPEGKPPSTNPEEIRQEASKNIQEMGFDTSTKEGQAAAGAAMFTQALAAGFQEYERKSGQPVPRKAMLKLEKILAQFAIPPRGQVQDIHNIPLSSRSPESSDPPEPPTK